MVKQHFAAFEILALKKISNIKYGSNIRDINFVAAMATSFSDLNYFPIQLSVFSTVKSCVRFCARMMKNQWSTNTVYFN